MTAAICGVTCRFGREVLDTAVKWTGDLLRHCYGAAAQEMWILDVGCGNATMLVGLAAQGFTNLAGQDYSGNSVVLARKVLQKYGLRHRIRVSDPQSACGAPNALAFAHMLLQW